MSDVKINDQVTSEDVADMLVSAAVEVWVRDGMADVFAFKTSPEEAKQAMKQVWRRWALEHILGIKEAACPDQS